MKGPEYFLSQQTCVVTKYNVVNSEHLIGSTEYLTL